MAIVGIDLGTTNSLVACYKDGEVHLIPNRLSDVLTPSVVTILDDTIYVGKSAKEKQVLHPNDSASAFKRFMGTDKIYGVGNKKLSPVELSAFILQSLVKDAESYLGEEVTEAVISVPAYFNDNQRKCTIDAAHIAGLKVERLINEPTAAAMAYHLHDGKDETVVAIIDLGGGTFDVSVLDIFDDVIEVRAVAGDNYLGGEDFDEALMNYFSEKLLLDLSKMRKEDVAKLRFASEQLKRKLSEHKYVSTEIKLDDKIYTLEIKEHQFEKVAESLVSRMTDPIYKALRDSQFNINEVDEVILVGGSTRMPNIKKFVTKSTGKFPLCHLNPDEVVVRGAAIMAAMKDKDIAFKDSVMTDVCPYTLGTTCFRTLEDEDGMLIYDPLIERNQTIPTSIQKSYYNAGKNQSKISVCVYQGDSFNIDDNIKLGELFIPIPRGPKYSVLINVRFTYDINGILEVEVEVPSTGKKTSGILINNNNLSEEDIQEKLIAISSLKILPEDQEENVYLVSRGERLYEMCLGQKRQEIGSALIEFRAALLSQSAEKIKQQRAIFKQFLDYVEAHS